MPKTEIIKINPENPDKKAIDKAAGILKKGGLVAFPTETVYGLGALYGNKKAMKRIYEVKQRPETKPLTVHISKTETITSLGCDIPRVADILIKKFWPGPLTIILKSAKGGKPSIAFRMPEGKIATRLIEASGGALVAPSANISGEKPSVNVYEVLASLDGRIDAVIDGGSVRIGVESTVIDATVFPCRVLREGAISKTSIQDAWQHDE